MNARRWTRLGETVARRDDAPVTRATPEPRSPVAGLVRRRAGWGMTAIVLVTGLTLTGCAAQPDITADDAAAFRAQIVAVAERSAAGDFAGAGAELAALESAVAEASGDGALASDRNTRITEAIAAVRADLDAQIQAQQAAEQAAREAAEAAQQAAAEEVARVAAEQAAAEEVARREAEERNDRDNRGPGNNGNGNGNNGNGNRGGDPDEDDE